MTRGASKSSSSPLSSRGAAALAERPRIRGWEVVEANRGCFQVSILIVSHGQIRRNS